MKSLLLPIKVLLFTSLPLLLINLAAAHALVSAEVPRCVVSLMKEKKLIVYTLDRASGGLREESRVQTRGGAGAMCFDATGNILYVGLKGFNRTDSIAVYKFDKNFRLALIDEVEVGAYAGYLSIHPSGGYLLSSYYSGGQVAVHRIEEDGMLSSEPIEVIKTDEKAHSVALDSSGRFVFVSHTAPNTIHQFEFDADTGRLTANEPDRLLREVGAGPRHLWFHPELPFAYGSDEAGCSITAYRIDPSGGQLSLLETLPSLPEDGYEGKKSTSDIEVHPSGRFVYIANRGHNTIASFELNESTGRLTLIEHTPVEPVPRSFNISADGAYLVQAGQKSGKLAVFRIQSDGKMDRTQTLEIEGSPWWVTFQP